MRKPLSLEMRCVKFTSGACYTCAEPGAQKAHYEAFVMDVPKGWNLVHKPENRFNDTCVNPDHLMPVMPVEVTSKRDSVDWYHAVRDCGLSRECLAYRMKRHHLTVEEAIAWTPTNRGGRPRSLEPDQKPKSRKRSKVGVIGQPGEGVAANTYDFRFLRDGIYKTPRELAASSGLNVSRVYDRLAAGASFEDAVAPILPGRGRKKS